MLESKSAFREGFVFFRLCSGEVSNLSFSFCDNFTREARNDLAKPALERDRIKAFASVSVFDRLVTQSRQSTS